MIFERESGPSLYASRLLKMPPKEREPYLKRLEPEKRDMVMFYIDQALGFTPAKFAETVALMTEQLPVEYRARARQETIARLRA